MSVGRHVILTPCNATEAPFEAWDYEEGYAIYRPKAPNAKLISWRRDDFKRVDYLDKGKPMISELKDYLKTHKDLIFTVLFLALADSLFLDGALRTKLQGILHKVTDRLEAKVDAKP
jgi:hypothetical protein